MSTENNSFVYFGILEVRVDNGRHIVWLYLYFVVSMSAQLVGIRCCQSLSHTRLITRPPLFSLVYIMCVL